MAAKVVNYLYTSDNLQQKTKIGLQYTCHFGWFANQYTD